IKPCTMTVCSFASAGGINRSFCCVLYGDKQSNSIPSVLKRCVEPRVCLCVSLCVSVCLCVCVCVRVCVCRVVGWWCCVVVVVLCVCPGVSVCVCLCVCRCVKERDRDGERECVCLY